MATYQQWSQSYFTNLTPDQHNVNNQWFQSMRDKLTDSEIKERIESLHDVELYEELVDNVTQQYPKQNYNQGLWLQPLFLSNLSQIGQEQVNGANILCVLIVNQSAKFITLVGQDYNALNVKNVLTNYSGA